MLRIAAIVGRCSGAVLHRSFQMATLFLDFEAADFSEDSLGDEVDQKEPVIRL